MADEDINKAENFMNNLNRLGQANQNEDIDEILSGLLSSSISATPAEDLNDLDDISCEYTELNNTIDALNSYLDVWEERHRNLRAKVRAALVEGEKNDVQYESSNTSVNESEAAIKSTCIQEHKPVDCSEESNSDGQVLTILKSDGDACS
ncbi:hypothetical protein RRG08_038545 [Elysia crispata]|uniref:Uncharacterized protein n=1 Tax=Elysia crispata TaxID=231223 RepID=A0AAE1ARP0_9GAST|nr:hypothetical protein RRG08_038545 [Elysia crispata]